MRKLMPFLVVVFIVSVSSTFAEDVRVTAWYGDSTFVYSSTLLNVVSFLNNSDTVRGGSAFGIDFWLGNQLQYGIGTAYILSLRATSAPRSRFCS